MAARSSTYLSVGIASLLVASAFAQNEPRRTDPARPTTPGTTTMPGTTTTANSADSTLAAWLLVANENEIALAQFAQERAKNDEVKQFAKRMIDDHRQMVTKLQKLAGSAGMDSTTRGTATDSSGRRDGTSTDRTGATGTGGRTETGGTGSGRGTETGGTGTGRGTETGGTGTGRGTETGGTGTGRGTETGGTGTTGSGTGTSGTSTTGAGMNPTGLGTQGLNVVALVRDLGRECLASTRRELESKSGAEFDKCYMTHAVMAHQHSIDTINVFRNHASNDLRQVLAEAQPTVQAHLEHAKSICKKVEGEKGDKAGDK